MRCLLSCGVRQEFLLNLRDQEWEIWQLEAQAWSRDAMVFDVWWNVLVMRECADKRGVVGMRLRIIPVELLRTAPNLITVADDLD